MAVPETTVSMCQFEACKGETCELYDRCNHQQFRKPVPEPTTRTCPECGHVNGREAMNCEVCDYPLQF